MVPLIVSCAAKNIDVYASKPHKYFPHVKFLTAEALDAAQEEWKATRSDSEVELKHYERYLVVTRDGKTLSNDYVQKYIGKKKNLKGVIEVQLFTKAFGVTEYPSGVLDVKNKDRVKFYTTFAYQVRVRSVAGKGLEALQNGPDAYQLDTYLDRYHVYNQCSGCQPSFKFEMPEDRTPDADGWITSPWAVLKYLNGYTSDGTVRLSSGGFRPAEIAVPSNKWSLNNGNIGYMSPRIESWLEDHYLSGDAALEWAEKVGDQLKAESDAVGDAPEKYLAFIKEYQSYAPSFSLRRKCYSGWGEEARSRLSRNWDPLTRAEKAHEFIPVARRDYRDFDRCVAKFFDTFDYGPWLENFDADTATEEELAALAQLPDNKREPISVELEEERMQDYVDTVTRNYEIVMDSYYDAIDRNERIQDEFREQEAAHANMIASIQAFGNTYQRQMEQRNYEMQRDIERMKSGANPSRKEIAVATPDAQRYLENGGAAIIERDRRLAEERKEREKNMAEATASKASASVQGGAARQDVSSTSVQTGTMTGAGDPTSIAETQLRDTQVQQGEVAPEPASEPTPEPPPKPTYYYTTEVATTANYRGVGTTRSNAMYDLEGVVVHQEDFHRAGVGCKVNNGMLLIIEWTDKQGRNNDYYQYFRSSGAASANWWDKHGGEPDINGELQGATRLRSTVTGLSSNEHCTDFDTGWSDY